MAVRGNNNSVNGCDGHKVLKDVVVVVTLGEEHGGGYRRGDNGGGACYNCGGMGYMATEEKAVHLFLCC
ncbi:uncharacterized protein DS421_16g568730 [Arachis hypogaea]|nr:uncharacterized protein DS421_16g568730 [Arachis hypogaea]